MCLVIGRRTLCAPAHNIQYYVLAKRCSNSGVRRLRKQRSVISFSSPFIYILFTWEFDRAFAKSFAELTKVAFNAWPSVPGATSKIGMLSTSKALTVPNAVRRQRILLIHGFSILICRGTT